MTQHMIHIIKEASCSSSSGKSELTYQIGHDEQEQIHFRIFRSSGKGYFSSAWQPLKSILFLLEECQYPITGWTLQPLYSGLSINTSYFLLAALKNEGLVEQWKRTYNLTDIEAFKAGMKQLIAEKKSQATDVDLDSPKKPTKPRKSRAPKTVSA